MWWLRTEDDMFTIRLGLIVEEQSYAPHEPIFKVTAYIIINSESIAKALLQQAYIHEACNSLSTLVSCAISS
jgi:hypothetical protein